MPFCEYCGSSLEDNAKFCPNCGAKLSITSPKVNFESKNNSNNTNTSTNATPNYLFHGFGPAFALTLITTILTAGIIGLVLAVVICVTGDNEARKGAIAGIVFPIILALVAFVAVVFLSIFGIFASL